MYEIFEKELELQGLTVAEISRVTGISKSTLSDWKKGKFQLTDTKRRLIANALNCSLDYLDGLTPFRDGHIDLEAEAALVWERHLKAQEEPDEKHEILDRMQTMKNLLRDAPYKDFDLAEKVRSSSYYTDSRTRELASEIAKRDDLRIVFDALKDAPKEDIDFVIEMVDRLKK